MKIRAGFVSNSSSSSFIALGFSIKGVDIKKIILAFGNSEKEIDASIKESIEKFNISEEEAMNDYYYEYIYDIKYKDQTFKLLNGSDGGVKEDEEILALIIEEIGPDNSSFNGGGEITLNDDNLQYSIIKEIKNKIIPEKTIRIFYGVRNC